MKLPALLKLFHGVFHVTELRGGQIDRDIFLHRMPRLAKLGDFREFFRRLGEKHNIRNNLQGIYSLEFTPSSLKNLHCMDSTRSLCKTKNP